MKTFDALLRAAFKAGLDCAWDANSNPSFDEWRASVSGLGLDEPAEQIELARAGDIIELTTEDPVFEPVLGRHYRVKSVGRDFYYFDWEGDQWQVLFADARKVVPGRSA